MGLIKGLVKTAFYGGLIVGSFFLGRSLSGTDINKVYKFIDEHPNHERDIFLYVRNRLGESDSPFLDSLNIESLTEEQKREIVKDYLEEKIKQGYNQGRKSLENLSENISRFFSQ